MPLRVRGLRRIAKRMKPVPTESSASRIWVEREARNLVQIKCASSVKKQKSETWSMKGSRVLLRVAPYSIYSWLDRAISMLIRTAAAGVHVARSPSSFTYCFYS
jgi:hypothetical protein